MAIVYDKENSVFSIETQNTKYAFQVVEKEFLIHLYYGDKQGKVPEHKSKVVDFAPYYEKSRFNFLPDAYMQEYVGFDSGDFRTCSLKVRNADGNAVTVLKYRGHQVLEGRINLQGLPYAEGNETTETLEITLVDEHTKLEVKLYYTVFAKEDVISRYVRITNCGEEAVTIEKCMSLLLDLPKDNYDMISFYGRNNRERQYQRNPLFVGQHNVYSRRGASSHEFNPFIILCDRETTQTEGDAYGFNFVFSGNFLDEVEVDALGKTRVQIGLGSENFNWLLEVGESFVSPEAVMTYSSEGLGKMTRNFHEFIRGHILPEEPFVNRPVVLNTWEACFFDIDEDVMEKFAKAAAESGIDMLVMDDGWFGARNNDKAGLGDWYPNPNKFKNGLKSFVDKMKSYGLKFGIWVEPEMANPDSDLYRTHPEWCIECPGREKMLSRDQWVLDMSNPEVIAYLKDMFTKTFAGIEIDYFKWDMNRHLCQVGSNYLPKERQGETAYRHILGAYELLEWFHKQFPNAMIETCSGGGGRYDLGMMKYGTMIWTSDMTDPHRRIRIQYSSMMGYPASTMSCHVSDHKACEDARELKYRCEVALGGVLGYELHLPKSSEAMKERVKAQIASYRKYEDLILRGEYYSILNPYETNYSAYYYTNEDKDRILLSFLQDAPEERKEVVLSVIEAIESAIYVDEISGKKFTGKELREGITVQSDDSSNNSRMWYLVKKHE